MNKFLYWLECFGGGLLMFVAIWEEHEGRLAEATNTIAWAACIFALALHMREEKKS